MGYAYVYDEQGTLISEAGRGGAALDVRPEAKMPVQDIRTELKRGGTTAMVRWADEPFLEQRDFELQVACRRACRE